MTRKELVGIGALPSKPVLAQHILPDGLETVALEMQQGKALQFFPALLSPK